MSVLIITSVEKEAEALGLLAADDIHIVISGIGRTNAAIATTRAILEHGPFHCVINAGIAGALPNTGLAIGDALVATASVYFEEGLFTPGGFKDVTSLGIPLGDFSGNVIPAGSELLARAEQSGLATGRIATVATCSGTDGAALEVTRRTGAIAEAMEGAAVLHTARSFAVPAIEVRAISNTAGNRQNQRWDIDAALSSLHDALSLFLRG